MPYEGELGEQQTFTREEVEKLLQKRDRRRRQQDVPNVPKKDRRKRQRPPREHKTQAAIHRAQAINLNRLVTVNLKQQHFVNGKSYGPGEVQVPYVMAQQFLHTEHHAQQVEAQFYGEKAAIIGPRVPGLGHLVREVAPSMFDSRLETAEPAITTPRKG